MISGGLPVRTMAIDVDRTLVGDDMVIYEWVESKLKQWSQKYELVC